MGGTRNMKPEGHRRGKGQGTGGTFCVCVCVCVCGSNADLSQLICVSKTCSGVQGQSSW